jgi:hypothetical protein
MITIRDKLACLERELRIRRQVYPNRILTKRMSLKKAERELTLIEAIIEDYRTIIAAEETQIM